MCRAIKTLHNFSPPATNDDIRASSLQFVRKLSGFTKPSRANEEAFNRAVNDVAHAAHHLLESLVTNAPPRNRETEAVKAKTRSAPIHGSANHKRHEFAHSVCLVAGRRRYSVFPGGCMAVPQTAASRRVTCWIVSSTLSLDHAAAGRPPITRRSSHLGGVARSWAWATHRIFRDRRSTGTDRK